MKPLKIWAYLDNFFFHSFQGGTKGKIAKTIHWFFSIFPLVPPWKLWKKSCLNKLKFWEASRNQKRSICWKFKLSISLGTQKSAKTPPAVAKMIRPFIYPTLKRLLQNWSLRTKIPVQNPSKKIKLDLNDLEKPNWE